MSPLDLFLLVVLGAIWGASFLFIRIGAPALGRGVLLGVALSLVGAFSYGIAAVYASRTFRDLRPIEVSVNQLVVSGILLAPVAIATRTAADPRPDVIVSVLSLALLGTAVGYLIYFRLIQSAGPTHASTVTLLIPPFGVFFGSVVLGEPVGAGLVAGLALILLGIALVYGWVRAPRISFREATTSD